MNKLYYKSPIFLQHLYTTIYGYKLKRQRYNELYRKELKSYVNQKDERDILTGLMFYLKKNIPYYSNIIVDEKNKLNSFFKLPYTEKEDLRKDLENRSNVTQDVTIIKTGGTTGKSLKVYSSKLDKARRMAYLDYIKLINGVEPFSRRASFTGKEITPHNHKNILWRYNYAMNQILYASFKLNKENVKYVYKNLSKKKPETIDGFPSAIHLVAKYILMNDIEIDWKIKAIFPTAETLTSIAKEDIEEAFKTKVIDQYASSEGAPFIYSHENKYIVGRETGIIEFFKVENNIYDMVVTSYINNATPIVRYKIGDRVQMYSSKDYLNSFDDEVVISKILGRSTDYLVGLNNNIVTSANLANSVKEFGDKIIQSQFIQKKIGIININLIVSDDYDRIKDEKRFKYKLDHRFGESCIYHFNYLKEINKEKSGKTRFIINNIKD